MRAFKWVTLVGLGLASGQVKGSVVLTAEAPGVQTSQVSGVTTEDFEGSGWSAGRYSGVSVSSVVGTFIASTPGFAVRNADAYGGAGGVGQYFAVGSQSLDPSTVTFGTPETTLEFASPQSYLGIWFSAINDANVVELYSGNALLASLNTPVVFSTLSATPGYNGNPTPNYLNQDSGEPFAYLNFVGTNGTTFTKVVFKNPINSGIELDNFSIAAQAPASLPGTQIPDGLIIPDAVAVPLPGAAWSGLGLMGAVIGSRWVRRRN